MNTVPATVAWRLREVDAADSEALDAIADIHMELLGFGPMAGLGRRFVREICYRAHMEDGLLRAVLAEVDGVPAGFVAYTDRSFSFHRAGLKHHFVQAGAEALRAVLTRPARIGRLLRALRVLGSRRAELRRGRDPMGEVVCIAVRPQYTAPRFVRSAKVRISEELIRFAARRLRRAGIREMRMLVDEGNTGVLMLYHMLGARFEKASLGGEPQVEVWFDLTTSRLTADVDVPAAWLAEPGNDGNGSTWAAFRESIDDHERVLEIEARDHATRLRHWVPLTREMDLLDFGCGFGFVAAELAPHVRTVSLWDGSANVRSRCLLRTAHLPNVRYVDLSGPEEHMPRSAFDVITVHGVVQYMSPEEIGAWLVRWRGMLKPGGRLVLSDLIQPGSNPVSEIGRYLLFSVREGFFLDAVRCGLREFRRYAGARTRVPLTIVTPELLERWAAQAQLRVEHLPENLSYRLNRRTAVLRAHE